MTENSNATPLGTLIRAAEILEREAQAIHECETIDGAWDHSPIAMAAKCDYDEMLAVAKALRDSGMVLVPRVPTMQMVEAAERIGKRVRILHGNADVAAAIYAAMVAAYEESHD